MVKYSQVYSKFKQLADIPESEWCELEQYFKVMKFKKGEHLVHAGDSTENMYIITKGITRSYYIEHEGKEFNKIFLAEYEIASAYVEILLNVPARLNIQTLEDTEVLAVSFKEIEKMYQRDRSWNEIGRKIAEVFFILKEQREYEFLLLDAKSRYLNFVRKYGTIKNRIAQYHIASYLGITPVSLSRIINQVKV